MALGEKVYACMKDVNDYETEADEWVELPASFKERENDPRANLIAAKLRLKEDTEAVNKLNSLHVSEVLSVLFPSSFFVSLTILLHFVKFMIAC